MCRSGDVNVGRFGKFVDGFGREDWLDAGDFIYGLDE
jgi:hypothetical protein